MSSTITPIPRPGTEVIQVVENTSPTILVPTLVPCAVGVCRQVVKALTTNAAGAQQFNSGALISLPAFFVAAAAVGDPPEYTGLSGKSLVLSPENGADVTITFDNDSLSPAKVVATILDVFATEGLTEVTSFTFQDDSFVVCTTAVGETSELRVVTGTGGTDPEVLEAFGIGTRDYLGMSRYKQFMYSVPTAFYPDPRSNLDEIVIEPSTVEVFLALGGTGASPLPVLKTETFLRRFENNTTAVITGTVDMTGVVLADLADTVVNLLIDKAAVAVEIVGTPANVAAVLAAFNDAAGETIATLATGTNYLVLSSPSIGGAGSVKVVSGTGTTNPLTTLGLVAADEDIGLSTISGVSDSTSSTQTNTISVAGEDFDTDGDQAGLVANRSVTGTYASLLGLTLKLSDGHATSEYTFTTLAAVDDVIDQLNAAFGSATGWYLEFAWSPTNILSVTNTLYGDESIVHVVGGTSLSVLGLTQQIVGTVDLTGLTYPYSGSLELTVGTVDYVATITTAANAAAIITQLNAEISADATAEVQAGTNFLLIQANDGPGVAITITGGDFTDFGFTENQTTTSLEYTRGAPCPPAPGDEVWADGELLGIIRKVAPGGNIDQLRLDRKVALSPDVGKYGYIQAKKLSQAVSTATRPTPDLLVDGNGNAVIKHELLRDTKGAPLTTGNGLAYLQYNAIRQDVSALSANPGLLKFTSQDDVLAAIEPVSVSNPLGLASYFMLLNAPTQQVTALGVDAVSASEVYGTVEAYSRAAEFLESFEVYALSPLTHSESVAQIFFTHVTEMSKPVNKGERIVLFNFETPTTKLHTLVASGIEGNSEGSTGTKLDTGISNLAQLLLAAGINPSGTIPVSAGLFLNVAGSSENFSVQSVTGSVVTIRTAFTSGQNDDSFYTTSDLNDAPLPSLLVDVAFSLKIRGASLIRANGTPDKDAMAEVVALRADAYKNRRFWSYFPDKCAALIGGVEQVIPGFYMCAAHAGLIAAQSPSQSFTNFPTTGFTRVIGSNNYFSEPQLDLIAGGGNNIMVQDAEGAPLISRMALTTDTTSVETRTDSITKALDYAAKFVRRSLRNFIGRFNITKGLLDTLNSVIQGVIQFLVDQKIIAGGTLTTLAQSKTQPDTVLVSMVLDPYYSLNYVRVTMRI